jgi:hypothetical protein
MAGFYQGVMLVGKYAGKKVRAPRPRWPSSEARVALETCAQLFPCRTAHRLPSLLSHTH